MSVNLVNQYVLDFSTNLELLLQQKQSRFRGFVMEQSCVGENSSPVDQFGAVEMSEVTDRFAPMPRTDAIADRRWIQPTDWDLNQLIDSFDKLRLLTDPTSIYAQNASQSAGRKIDDVIIKNFFATAQTGKQGGNTEPFGTNLTTAGTPGQNVSVSQGAAGATGLTVAKLREAKKRLMQAEVDLQQDPVYIGVTAQDHDNLLAEAQVVSTDFNNEGGAPVLKEGLITRFLGINFIHTERLQTGTDDAAGTSRMIPVYAKSGMVLGMWSDMQIDIAQRKDLRGLPWQVYTKITMGATRKELPKVVRIWAR